jgi:hypothetical protein
MIGASLLGIGVVSAAGCGIESFRAAMQSGMPPVIKRQQVEIPDGVIEVPYYEAPVSGLDQFVPANSIRRMPRFSQMALLAAHLAVNDSGIKPADSRTGIVFGSGYGPLQAVFSFLDSVIDGSDNCPSPTLFATSVHNSLASIVSISMKIHGPSLTLTAFENTPACVLQTAGIWLQKGDLDYVLVGLGDEFCAVRGYATAMLAGNSCAYPAGEGFVCLLLGRSDQRGRRLELEFGAGESRLASAAKTMRHARLYGSMPAGLGFEIAAAACAEPESVCVQYDTRGRFAAVRLFPS